MSTCGRESAVMSLPLLLRVPVLSDQGSTFMTSFNLNCYLEAVFLIRSYERVGLQHMNLERGHSPVCYSHTYEGLFMALCLHHTVSITVALW